MLRGTMLTLFILASQGQKVNRHIWDFSDKVIDEVRVLQDKDSKIFQLEVELLDLDSLTFHGSAVDSNVVKFVTAMLVDNSTIRFH